MPREETGVDGIGVDIAVGMRVVRGPDWQYGGQDGFSNQSPPSRKKLTEVRGLVNASGNRSRDTPLDDKL